MTCAAIVSGVYPAPPPPATPAPPLRLLHLHHPDSTDCLNRVVVIFVLKMQMQLSLQPGRLETIATAVGGEVGGWRVAGGRPKDYATAPQQMSLVSPPPTPRPGFGSLESAPSWICTATGIRGRGGGEGVVIDGAGHERHLLWNKLKKLKQLKKLKLKLKKKKKRERVICHLLLICARPPLPPPPLHCQIVADDGQRCQILLYDSSGAVLSRSKRRTWS